MGKSKNSAHGPVSLIPTMSRLTHRRSVEAELGMGGLLLNPCLRGVE